MFTVDKFKKCLESMNELLSSNEPPKPLCLTSDVWDLMEKQGFDMSDVKRLQLTYIENK